MELAFLTPLLKDSANGISRGVSINNKGVIEMGLCYDPGSSLRKRNDLQGKDGSTSVFRNLTNGSAWADSENNVSGARASGSKGEPVTTTAEAGAEDTSSDGY